MQNNIIMKSIERPKFRVVTNSLPQHIIAIIFCLIGLSTVLIKYSFIKKLAIVIALYLGTYLICLITDCVIYSIKMNKYSKYLEINNKTLKERFTNNLKEKERSQNFNKYLVNVIKNINNLLETNKVKHSNHETEVLDKLHLILTDYVKDLINYKEEESVNERY